MSSPIRALYLSYDGLTDPLGQSQVLPYVIGLSKFEFEFTVVSFEKTQAIAALSNEIKIICRENRIAWMPLKYHKWPPVLSTLYDIWRLWQCVKKIQRQKKINIIHCRSYITSLVGLRAKKKWGVKFIFDMRGFWADERVEGGLWNLGNPLYRLIYNFFKRKEKQFIAEADHVISLTHNAKNEIESWGIKNAPITVIPTCVDLDLFDPNKIKKEEQAALQKSLGIRENDFVLLYLGSWGTWYLTDEMFIFFEELKKKKPDAKFLIVSADAVDLEKCRFKEHVIVTASPRKSVPLYISIASVSICFLKTSFSKKASSATKMGEIMAMNIPVITNKGWGDVDAMATKTQILLTDLGNYASVIDQASSLKVDNLRTFCEENLSLDISIDRYGKIYASIESHVPLQRG